MTYALSAALQASIYAKLSGDNVVAGLVGDAIYDALPGGALPETFISLGSEQVRDASDKTANGAVHRIDVSVRTQKPGFSEAKRIAVAVSDALHHADLTMDRGRLVSLRFLRAQARRLDQSAGREIRMQFSARVDDD